jgi:hypothetical protein
MTAANKIRRNVMLMAWGSKRAEPTRSFADCLRGAWAYEKRAAKSAAKFIAKARRGGGWVHFSPSLIRSQSTNHFAGQTYGRTRDQQAGRMISRVGR